MAVHIYVGYYECYTIHVTCFTEVHVVEIESCMTYNYLGIQKHVSAIFEYTSMYVYSTAFQSIDSVMSSKLIITRAQ